MQLIARGGRFLNSRLAWRLTAVFVGAALLPLAASDWLATTAIGDLSHKLYQQRRAELTRDVALQVFDRLLLAKTLLRALPPASALAPAPEPARGSPFLAWRCRGSAADQAPRGALETLWAEAAPAQAAAVGEPVVMRLHADAQGRPLRVLLSARSPGGQCLGELDGNWLWSPVRDAGDESSWIVVQDHGPTLLATQAASDDAGAPVPDRFRAHLFLGAEFAAPSWIFEQATAQPPVTWHGRPIVSWLASVAVATLLGIALFGHWMLRRTLEPLRQLTAGSRRLAAGASPIRVDVRGDDELGELATSFNDMASQLEARLAALRGLADIDAGILGKLTFDRLARSVCERLAAAYPGAAIAVVWRDSASGFHRVRNDDADSATAIVPGAAAIQCFEHAQDALQPIDAHLGQVTGEAPAAGATLHVFAVRDGQRNQALISLRLPAPDAGVDLAHCVELRDRLSVAFVARNREAELEHRATHDALTGLRNSSGLQLALTPALARDERMALLFIDLDHFKDVNDCHGHGVGDRLLQAAARRLARIAPQDGVLSRNGGDEFVLALPNADAGQASALAARIVAEFDQPFVLAGMELACGASIGIALAPQHGMERSELMRCADIALYESKNGGRARSTLFVPEFDTALRERNELLAGLVRGLARDEFVVHYQPRLNALSREITSAEALVRWQHPERGMIAPGAFIGLAESSGHIDRLGPFVLETAIRQMAEWRRSDVAINRVSVNVSQRQFAAGALVPTLRALLDRHGLPATCIEIEVTESLMGGDMASVRAQLQEMRAMGLTIAMDDFGTGYSSMAMLRRLPIDVMKIDRAFVKDLETDPDAVAIAQTIVTFARALGLAIVAEGIETEAQAARLGAMGCDEFQGFLFARALPAAEFAALAGRARRVAAPGT